MSVLTESLLTLVCSHLVALFLLTVWHSLKMFKWLIFLFVFLYLFVFHREIINLLL